MISVQFNYQSSPLGGSGGGSSSQNLRITDQQTFKDVEANGGAFFLKQKPLGKVTVFGVTPENLCGLLIEGVDYIQSGSSISLSVKSEQPLIFVVLPYTY